MVSIVIVLNFAYSTVNVWCMKKVVYCVLTVTASPGLIQHRSRPVDGWASGQTRERFVEGGAVVSGSDVRVGEVHVTEG